MVYMSTTTAVSWPYAKRSIRVARLDEALREQAATWRFLPVVKALMTLRGIEFLSGITIVAELGDLRRFPHPRDLMGYLGLVPGGTRAVVRASRARSRRPETAMHGAS